MTAKTIEAARIGGALKCLDMLRQLEQSVGNKAGGYSPATYAARCLSDARSILDGLGPMTLEQEGFITCLIEYAQEVIEFGQPCAEEGWRGYSAMTDEERLAMLESEEAEYAEIEAPHKVISLDERRAAR